MGETINTPAGFGGLLRYNEEYTSRFMLKPEQVLVFVIAVIVFSIILRLF